MQSHPGRSAVPRLRRLSYLMSRHHVYKLLLFAVSLVVFCELLIYPLVLLQCTWPSLDPASADPAVPPDGLPALRALILADPHLLGPFKGHWLDRLRREWSMKRVFHTAMWLHHPDLIFILGDLFDEGQWVSPEYFEEEYLSRFADIFFYGRHQQMYVVVGNHDIGYHYVSANRQLLVQRFERSFGEGVRLVRVRGVLFLLVNAMAMEGDGCSMCGAAEKKLAEVSQALRCAEGSLSGAHCRQGALDLTGLAPHSRPLLMMHFPLFRPSDENCTGDALAPGTERTKPFREKWDCLSSGATARLLEQVKPRAAFTGHTHHGCFIQHDGGMPEWTIASFSWRNRDDPHFLLAAVSNNNLAVKTCFSPRESLVLNTYMVACSLVIITSGLLFLQRRYLIKRD